MDDAEDTDLPETSARVAVLESPAGPYPEAEQWVHAAYEPLGNDPSNASLRIPKVGASGVARGARDEPSGAVASPGYASSNVPEVRGYSHVVGQGAQVVDMVCLAPVKQSHHWSEIFPASQSNLKEDAPIQVALPKKLTVDNLVPKYYLPPRKSIVKIWAQDKARTQPSRKEPPFESLGRESSDASQRIPQQGAYGVGSGGRGVPFRADYDTHRNSVANHGPASSEVPEVQGYSYVVDEAAQVIDMQSHAPVQRATRCSVNCSPSQNNVKGDAPVKLAATKKSTVPKHFPKYSLPPRKSIVKRWALDTARTLRSGDKQAFEPVIRETRNASRGNPQVGASGFGSGAGGELSSSDYDVNRNSVAKYGYTSSEVPVVRAFTQNEYAAAQSLLKLSRASGEEDNHSAEIVPLSPSRMTTDAPIQVAPPVKLPITHEVAEISLRPRKVISKRRARNPGQSTRSRGKKPNTVAPASTIRVRKAARLQCLGTSERSAVEQEATPRFAPRTKTNYRPAGEGEDRPFKCTVAGCKSSFISNGHLQQHIRTVHNGERDFICKEVIRVKDDRVTKRKPCGRGFASDFALKLVRSHFIFQLQ